MQPDLHLFGVVSAITGACLNALLKWKGEDIHHSLAILQHHKGAEKGLSHRASWQQQHSMYGH